MEFAFSLIRKLHHMRRKLATVAVGILALMLGWHVVFGANGMLTYTQKRAEYRKLQGEIESLHQENQRLQQQVEGLKNDPAAIEKEAREQLRYARPGEKVYAEPVRPEANTQAARADNRAQ